MWRGGREMGGVGDLQYSKTKYHLCLKFYGSYFSWISHFKFAVTATEPYIFIDVKMLTKKRLQMATDAQNCKHQPRHHDD